MTTPRFEAESGILYVRAALRPFVGAIKSAGGVREFLAEYFQYNEIFSPYFRGARPFWERRSTEKRVTNSGAMGKMLAEVPSSKISDHPSHSLVGIGNNVEEALRLHDYRTSCFDPINTLARSNDFSMLLLGCCDTSPGFSTVHATQHALNLSQKHLIRYLLRWDIEENGKLKTVVPSESPGCSSSFGKFYPEYKRVGILYHGRLLDQKFIYVQSAAKAMEIEKELLTKTPRFVNCGKAFCSTCNFRLY